MKRGEKSCQICFFNLSGADLAKMPAQKKSFLYHENHFSKFYELQVNDFFKEMIKNTKNRSLQNSRSTITVTKAKSLCPGELMKLCMNS